MFATTFSSTLQSVLDDPRWQPIAACIDEDVAVRLLAFAEQLVKANESVNVTALTDPVDVAVKHVADSLLALTVGEWPKGAKVCDVGTGGGVPGVILKIVRPDLDVTLVDAVQKKLRVVEAICEALSLPVETVHARAESLGKDAAYRESFDVVVARAVARMPVLLELCLPLVRVGGRFIAMKGPNPAEEIEASQRALHLLGGEVIDVKQLDLPLDAGARTLIVVHKHSATPSQYPRSAGTPAKRPL